MIDTDAVDKVEEHITDALAKGQRSNLAASVIH